MVCALSTFTISVFYNCQTNVFPEFADLILFFYSNQVLLHYFFYKHHVITVHVIPPYNCCSVCDSVYSNWLLKVQIFEFKGRMPKFISLNI